MRNSWTIKRYVEELIYLHDEGVDTSILRAEIISKFSKTEREDAFLVF